MCLGEGGGVRIDSLSKLPPDPKVGSGESGFQTNKKTEAWVKGKGGVSSAQVTEGVVLGFCNFAWGFK